MTTKIAILMTIPKQSLALFRRGGTPGVYSAALLWDKQFDPRRQRGNLMPSKRTVERARKDARRGKAATTQAGEFVREEMEHARSGKHRVKNPKQAIAIGLSKARRSGVNLKPPKKGRTSAATRKKAERDYQRGQSALRKSGASSGAKKRSAGRKSGTHKRAKRSSATSRSRSR